MNRQEEEQIMLAFSKEVKETFFYRIPPLYWKVEKVVENFWLFGVKNEYIETYPYLYSVHFDWKNRVFTIELEQEIQKSMYLFPHVYHRFLHFLKERGIDVLIRNDNYSLKQPLYQRKTVPLHASGVGGEQIISLLETFKDEITSGAFYFWKAQNSIHFSTPLVPNFYYSMQFLLNEKEHPTQGMVHLPTGVIKQKAEIRQLLEPITTQMGLLEQKEREIIDYLAHLHPKNYYDPTSQSLCIFKKNVPFSIKLLLPEAKEQPYRYRVHFGSEETESTDLMQLIEDMKRAIHQYVLEDRLRAVVEGRV